MLWCKLKGRPLSKFGAFPFTLFISFILKIRISKAWLILFWKKKNRYNNILEDLVRRLILEIWFNYNFCEPIPISAVCKFSILSWYFLDQWLMLCKILVATINSIFLPEHSTSLIVICWCDQPLWLAGSSKRSTLRLVLS